MNDRQRFQTAIVALWDTLNPGKPFPIQSQRGYYAALEHLPIDLIESAIQQAMRQCTFFPKPAELIALATDDGITVEDGWRELNEAIDGFGYTNTPNLSNRVSWCVQILGGWEYLCGMRESEFNAFVFPRFKDAWRNSKGKAGRLIGYHDRNNQRRISDQPKRIGSPGASGNPCNASTV